MSLPTQNVDSLDDAARRELEKKTQQLQRQEFLRRKVKREVTSYVVEVIELCTLAGLHDRAAEFIGARISIKNVRNTLQTIRAESAAAFDVGGHITADATGNESRSAAMTWSKAFADARNRPQGE